MEDVATCLPVSLGWYMDEVGDVATCRPVSLGWYMDEVGDVATCLPVSLGWYMDEVEMWRPLIVYKPVWLDRA